MILTGGILHLVCFWHNETTIELFNNNIQLFMKIKQSEINGDFCIIFNQIFSTFGIQGVRGKSWQSLHSYNQITCTKSPKKGIVVNNFQPLQIIIKQMPGSKENSKFSFVSLRPSLFSPEGQGKTKLAVFLRTSHRVFSYTFQLRLALTFAAVSWCTTWSRASRQYIKVLFS